MTTRSALAFAIAAVARTERALTAARRYAARFPGEHTDGLVNVAKRAHADAVRKLAAVRDAAAQAA